MLHFTSSLLLVLIVINIRRLIAQQIDELVIETEYGLVKGMKNVTIQDQKPYYAFKGIPFAQPPLGDLRFEPPVAPNPWDDIKDATKEANQCVQGVTEAQGSEDCLYLNVYTPKLPSAGTNVSLPVMVWIYGGGFIFGNSFYDSYGPDYFLEQDVLLVSINYRLEIFGFISTNDLVAPGNGGLKDQSFALKWVKQNIANFGGNPNNVTIFGQSAGSASVSYHLQSKMSKGYFQRAILHSGTSLSLWSLSRYVRKAVVKTAAALFIDTSSSESIIQGLKQVDYRVLHSTSTLVSDTLQVSKGFSGGIIFAPVIEVDHPSAFFTNKSHELLRRGEFERVPTIIGYTSNEGNSYRNPLVSLYFGRFDLDLAGLVPKDMNIEDSSLERRVGAIIKNHYWGVLPIIFESDNTYKFLSEDWFIRPTHEAMKLQSQFANVFCYRFSYEGQLGGVDHTTSKGVQHAEDLGYFFRRNNESADASPSDQLTRSRSIKLWTNFVKYGNPTPLQEELFQNITWPLYTVANSQDVKCMDIGRDLTIVTNPNFEAVKFYKDLYTKYGNPPYDTY